MVIKTHDGPKTPVSPYSSTRYVCLPYLVLIIYINSSTVRSTYWLKQEKRSHRSLGRLLVTLQELRAFRVVGIRC